MESQVLQTFSIAKAERSFKIWFKEFQKPELKVK